MQPIKMHAIVQPMLSARAQQMLAGAPLRVAADLLGATDDVGVTLRVIEGLAGVTGGDGGALGAIALGDDNPNLGSYSSAASTAQSAKNAALNANSESAKAKQAKTKDEATPHLQNALQFIQSAVSLLGKAQNDYNSTDPATDPNGVDTGVAQGAISSAQSAIAGAQANLDSAAAFANTLPSTSGGGPVAKTCPSGQHLDANNNCVPDTTVTVNTSSGGIGWGVVAGVAAGLAALYWYTEQHKGKHRKMAA